jgi:hypothetical protein
MIHAIEKEAVQVQDLDREVMVFRLDDVVALNVPILATAVQDLDQHQGMGVPVRVAWVL